MSENILSLEDLKFLEDLHYHHDVQYLRLDEEGLKTNRENLSSGDDSTFDTMNYLSEISKKLKYRLGSNFQLNFSSGFHLDVVRV